MKINGKAMMSLIAMLILCSCGNPSGAGSSSAAMESASAITSSISITCLEETVDFHTEEQNAFLDDADFSEEKIGAANSDCSSPEKTFIEFTDSRQNDNTTYEITYTCSDGISHAAAIDRLTKKYYLINLKAGEEYTLNIHSSDGEDASKTFRTSEKAPRNLFVERVTNVRDLGGWNTASSKVKQGLIYRGSQLNYSSTEKKEPSAVVSANGLSVLHDDLQIKTEMDLRELNSNGYADDENLHSLIDGASFVACPMSYSDPADEERLDSVRAAFGCFADKNSYPIYMHCSAGCDRTGYLSYLLNGFLGVSKADLIRDYLFSDFGGVSKQRTIAGIQSLYLDQIDAETGDTYQDKITNYLLNYVKVTQDQLDAIRSIML